MYLHPTTTKQLQQQQKQQLQQQQQNNSSTYLLLMLGFPPYSVADVVTQLTYGLSKEHTASALISVLV